MTDNTKPVAAKFTKTKTDLAVSTTAYTTPVPTPTMSPVSTSDATAPTNEYIFKMEVDSPASAPQDQVQQLLDAEDLVPVHKPTVIDVCSFQEALVNALAQCRPTHFFEENVGLRFLNESSINYQARIGVNALLKWPATLAALCTVPDTLQLRLRETQQKSFVICSRLENA